jgi:hypothetical protein
VGASVAKGSTLALKFKPFAGLAGRAEGTITVVEYDAPRRVVFRGQMGKMEPTRQSHRRARRRGISVTRRFEMEPHGLLRLIAPLMGRLFGKQNPGLSRLSTPMERPFPSTMTIVISAAYGARSGTWVDRSSALPKPLLSVTSSYLPNRRACGSMVLSQSYSSGTSRQSGRQLPTRTIGQRDELYRMASRLRTDL